MVLVFGVLLSATSQQAPAQITPGFVQQDIIKQANITTDAQTYGLSTTNKQTTRTYYDGLGRTLQTVVVGASPLNNDMIQPMAYDNLGRQAISYLPYAGQSADTAGNYRGNAISTAQPAFYNQTGQYLVAIDAAPYTQKVFENSPLQRMLQAGMVGNGFQPVSGQHYKTLSYRYNKSSDGNILIWNPDGTFTSNNFYAVNTLTVIDAKDEDNTETLTFTDLAGRVILKRQLLIDDDLDTYYIYNNAGMLAYIVPPQATSLLAVNSYNLSATPLSNMVFKFTYDTMGRLIEKTVPAKGIVYTVYDPMNRPVLIQDANMLANNQWNYIKYDAKGRAISQGIFYDGNSGHNGRANMQGFINSNYGSASFEIRSTSSTNGGYYTNNVFPTGTATGTTLTALAYSYFDDYNLTGTATFTYVPQGLTGEIGATSAAVKGMPTVISKTTLGTGVTSGTWLTTAMFYDKRGNPIQTQSNSQLNYINATTVPDIKTMLPDFMGVPQISLVSKTASGTTVTVQTNFTYDQVYRIQTITQSYNGTAAATIASYDYNELGQVIKKGLGLNAGAYLQNVDMRYNIRGQLLSINNSKLSYDGGIKNSDYNDVFGIEFLYDQSDGNLGNIPYYNGKLSAVKWMTGDGSGNNTYERAYKYSYDAINRYTAASYVERTTTGTGSFNNNIGGFDESGITYDFNGNILTLNRNSSTEGTNSYVQIDNLTYGYSATNPNQLLTVTDGTDANHTGAGFRNYTGSTGSYSYDANGNLTADPYKGISLIQYNVLNRIDNMTLTYNATGRYIKYTYDAGGILIRKQVYDNNTLGTTTDYIDGFVYTTSGTGTAALTYFAMPEGRVLYASGAFTKEFVITDQQGNARISFNNTGSGGTVHVVQEDSYYGFGMVMNGSTTGGDNRQLYNGGSEWQNDYGSLPDYYQTFNRNYDAALGRWIGVDPKAEGTESMTTYQYARNNPIMFNDPLGDLARTVADQAPPCNCNMLNAADDDMGSWWADVELSMASDYASSQPGGYAYIGYNTDPEGRMPAVPNGLNYDTHISGSQIWNFVNDLLTGLPGVVAPPTQDKPSNGTSVPIDEGPVNIPTTTGREQFNAVTPVGTNQGDGPKSGRLDMRSFSFFTDLGNSNSMAAAVEGFNVSFQTPPYRKETFPLNPIYVSVPKTIMWNGKQISQGYAAEKAADAANEAADMLSLKYLYPPTIFSLDKTPLYLYPGSGGNYPIDFIRLMNSFLQDSIPGSRVRFLQPGDSIIPQQAVYTP